MAWITSIIFCRVSVAENNGGVKQIFPPFY